jgi:hypothetical protein
VATLNGVSAVVASYLVNAFDVTVTHSEEKCFGENLENFPKTLFTVAINLLHTGILEAIGAVGARLISIIVVIMPTDTHGRTMGSPENGQEPFARKLK